MIDLATKILALDDKGLRSLLEQMDIALKINESEPLDMLTMDHNLVSTLRAASNLAISKLLLLRALNSEFIKPSHGGEAEQSNSSIRAALENDPVVKFLTKTSYH